MELFEFDVRKELARIRLQVQIALKNREQEKYTRIYML